jgi:16S rRNA C967 or C1407 C5-methylase (RsmB/RsmF family)
MDDRQFNQFVSTLTESLPVTFRINPSQIRFGELVQLLNDPGFIDTHTSFDKTAVTLDKHSMSQDRSQGPQIHLSKLSLDPSELSVSCKSYYPQNLVFELPNVCKDLLKKNEGLQPINQLLKTCNESGLITRQEIVSMLPPLLCGIQSHHAVFDMCAAPGSKTAQALELIMSDHLYTKQIANTTPP